ncbi:hypothetical protein V5799_022497 [Amblyomma americanum]|uniref:Uncharacterized protein n=1 Tax=Amblyomma americanum TaxID=6943 RepID=A0AAQ4FKF2_AMBAM
MLCMDRDKEYTVDFLSAIDILAHSLDEVTATTTQRCFHHVGFTKEVSTDQEECDDVSEAQAVFGLLAHKCGTSNATMDDYEAIDDDFVTCREDTLADILKKVEGGTGYESEDEIDHDDNHSSVVSTNEASQAVELL